MSDEQIGVTMAIDTNPFSRAITKAKSEMKDFGETGQSGFVRAQSAGREFRNTIRELGQTDMPLLGKGIQTVINGLENWRLALFAVAVSGIGFLMEKVKEYGKELDEQGAKNAEAIWGKKEIGEATQAVRELRREREAFQRSLNMDPVKDTLKAISEEKDPVLRLSQARQVRDRFETERNERLKQLKEVDRQRDQLELRKTKIPGELKAAQQTSKLLEDEGEPTIFTSAGFPDFAAEQFAKTQLERARLKASDRVRMLTSEQDASGTLLKLSGERSKDLSREASERNAAMRELQNMIDSLTPNDSFPRGKRVGSVSFSMPGLGAPPGMITIFDKMGAHLETIAHVVDGDHFKVLPVNGR